jgi:hypothetical protein
MDPKDIVVVVSRYNEDLNWTLEYPFHLLSYIVYNKGNNDNFAKKNVIQTIQLPNVGRCDHTYFYHLVSNYDAKSFTKITLFMPGSINMMEKYIKTKLLIGQILQNQKAVMFGKYEPDIRIALGDFVLDEWCSSSRQNNALNPESKLYPSSIRPYGSWFLHHFNDIKIDYYSYHGIFSIDRDDILQHPKERYENILNELSLHSNPEVGHYTERSWHALFHPLKSTIVIPTQRP